MGSCHRTGLSKDEKPREIRRALRHIGGSNPLSEYMQFLVRMLERQLEIAQRCRNGAFHRWLKGLVLVVAHDFDLISAAKHFRTWVAFSRNETVLEVRL